MTTRMDVIDGSWIKARLSARHGSQKALADAIGMPPDQLTKIMKGGRQVKAHEIPKILAYFNENQQPGLREPPAAYTAPAFAEVLAPSTTIDSITRAVCPGIARPFHYTATRSEPLAGILQGDILVIEHGGAHVLGELVLVSIIGESGEGINELRRHMVPHLASLDLTHPQPVLPDDSQAVGIIGRVAAVLRIPELTSASNR